MPIIVAVTVWSVVAVTDHVFHRRRAANIQLVLLIFAVSCRGFEHCMVYAATPTKRSPIDRYRFDRRLSVCLSECYQKVTGGFHETRGIGRLDQK